MHIFSSVRDVVHVLVPSFSLALHRCLCFSAVVLDCMCSILKLS